MGDFNEVQDEYYQNLLSEGINPKMASAMVGALRPRKPTCCDECGSGLLPAEGYVGRRILYCPQCGKIKWVDTADTMSP